MAEEHFFAFYRMLYLELVKVVTVEIYYLNKGMGECKF